MKKYLIFSVFAFLFIKSTAQVQEDIILLQPEAGMEYIYEFNDSFYALTEENERLNPFVKQKIIKIQYKKFQPESESYLLIKVEKNVAERPDTRPVQIKNYEYPDFKDGYYDQRYTDFFESLLCWPKFKYEFDLQTSKVKLINRDEVLLKIREVLNAKEFNKKSIKSLTENFNENGIPLISNIVQSIYRIPVTSFNNEPISQNDYKTEVKQAESGKIISQKQNEIKTGLYSRTIEVDDVNQYLIKYNVVEIDSLRYPVRAADNKIYHLKYNEKDISLVSKKIAGQNTLKIAGIFEQAKFKKVTLSLLRRPYGTTFHQEVVFLDAENSFQIETKLEHPQLVYLQFGMTNNTDNLPTLLFFAEPGSEINFEAKGESFPWKVSFLGNFKNATELIYNFRIKHPVFKERIRSGLPLWSSHRLDYNDLETAIKDFEPFFESNKNEINKNAYKFIKQEMKVQLLSSVVYFLNRAAIAQSNIFGYQFFENENINVGFLNDCLNTFNINLSFNQYGIHSRMFAQDYLMYSFREKQETADFHQTFEYSPSVVISNFKFNSDLVQKIQFARIILTGQALYEQIADILFQEKMRVAGGESQTEIFIQDRIDEYYDLMLRVCNDEEFNNEIEELVQAHLKWKDKDYVPDTKFMNPEGEETYMKDFFGEKPTIFYITRDWSAERYYFDDLSKENPGINYVMIMSGSNFAEWADYIERAEPVANQLFLPSQEHQLRDIFKTYYQSFIIYDESGNRLGYRGDPLNATNLTKHYLDQPKKKQLDKSQLQLIIYVLVGILILFIIGLIVWKWRVRQRFRKEEQRRRLRELELTAIRSQMNPHFLFNSLNSVQNLVQQNKGREAHLYLSDFAGLIRKVLQNSEKEEVSLTEELETVQQYLNLEKLRFDFDYSVHVEEGIDANNTMVPSMLLQPFAENAIIHGLQNKSNNRQLKIEVKKAVDDFGQTRLAHNNNSGIIITIEDNGIGRQAAKELSKQKNGKSSKLLKERLDILQQKQGEKYELNIIDLNGNKSGTRVEILVPEEK
jgi:hypothetical protein